MATAGTLLFSSSSTSSSSSSISLTFHDQYICRSFSSSQILHVSLLFPPKPPKYAQSSVKFRTLPFLHRTPVFSKPHVSLQDQASQDTEIPHQKQLSNGEYENPEQKTQFRSKNSIWINPKSSRSAQLKKQSFDSRYSFLSKISESLNSCNPDEKDVANILSGLGDNPLQQDAVIILNNMDNMETAILSLRWFQKNMKSHREAILYNVTLKVLKKGRNWDKAENLLNEMLEKGIKPDNITFSTMISCARLCSLPNKAVEWFEKMPEFGCKPDDVTYSAMIDAYGRAGNLDMALKLYDQARKEKWRLDLVTFSTLIRIYGKSGNFDGCLNVYEEMKALGVKPNLVIYNTLLDAMGRAGRPWQVKSIYREMNENGFLPNWTTYAALLRAFGRARYAEDALKIYKEMKEKGLELNVVLYNTILSMCADIGCLDEAIEIFKEMKKSEVSKPDSWTFSSMITIYSCSGQVLEAENMLKEMLEAGFEPNIFVLTSIIQCYGKVKRTDDVVRSLDQLIDLGITPDDRFNGCLLNVMTQTSEDQLPKLVRCIERVNAELGYLVKLLIDKETGVVVIREAAQKLFTNISQDVRKAYCNCLIDLCVNLNQIEKSCILLDLGIELDLYTDIQSKSPTQWSLHLKSLSLGAALTAFHVWMKDLLDAIKDGEELPPLLGIHTGHGKHKYSEKGLASLLGSHLKELNAPFHEASDRAGWFLTTKVAAISWLEARGSAELASS